MPGELEFERLPFDHPLYILYSSGRPACRSAWCTARGGTLLQHYKELLLHTDLKRDDSVFYFTTLRLDDVELARERARCRIDDCAIRWRAVFPEPIRSGRWPKRRSSLFLERARISRRCARSTGSRPVRSTICRALRTICRPEVHSPSHSFDYVYSK